MKKAAAALTIALALVAATSASARTHHHQRSGSAGYSKIDSGYGPPKDWSEIQSSVGGNSN
jgi:hypothetical protein